MTYTTQCKEVFVETEVLVKQTFDLDSILKEIETPKFNDMIQSKIIKESQTSEIFDFPEPKKHKYPEQHSSKKSEINYNQVYSEDPYVIYSSQLKNYPILDDTEVHNLVKLVKLGYKEAENKLVLHNLPLVIMVAKRYIDKGLDFMDLIQEGNLGLIKSVSKYNPKMGYKFSTCAVWWIVQSISRAISDKARTIRIPVYIGEEIRKLNKLNEKIKLKLQRDASSKELAKESGLDLNKIELLIQHNKECFSLDYLINETKDTIINFIKSKGCNTEEIVENNLFKKSLFDYFRSDYCCLKDTEIKFMMLIFGLWGKSEKNMMQISRKYNLSRYKLKKIENKILRKIKNCEFFRKQFYDYAFVN